MRKHTKQEYSGKNRFNKRPKLQKRLNIQGAIVIRGNWVTLITPHLLYSMQLRFEMLL